MIVTFLGMLFIPVGIALLFFDKKYLLILALLFAGFSGSAICIIGDLGIQPSYYFVMLCFAKQILLAKKIKIQKSLIKDNRYLVLFVMLGVLSLIMPLTFAKGISVMNVDGVITSVSFSSSNITQLMYLIFCVLFYFYFVKIIEKNSYERNMEITKWYIAGVYFAIIVSTYQIFAIKYGLPFDELFRQSPHGNVQGTRIYGPCIEASMLCYYLVSALPVMVRFKKGIINWIMMALNVGLGVYSFSSTYIFGLLIWILLEGLALFKKNKKKISSRYILVVLVAFLLMAIVMSQYSEYIVIAWGKLISTFQSTNISGIQRAYSAKLLFSAFCSSPVLGVGYGSCRGNDLLTTWLACVGILGILPIIAFVYKRLTIKGSDQGIKFSIVIVWALMLISVPEPYNLFIWMLLAFASIKRNTKDKNINEKA